jgi:hypothetical protein
LETNRNELAQLIEKELFDRHGPLIGNEALCSALGFSNRAALRQAVIHHRIGFPVFPLPQRRGLFALVKDVATWLVEQRELATAPKSHAK